ncbi:hypothetical protein QTG54_014186 [Skeletonema marinoi]|uniref:VWFA domain-containing protein n=1 Tax=Skeletonema marinoi TaxID=267567 RepID=A0AAD9D6W6_9STRA|nr:hypothetical protein QTG54_014186 [Skeletonema marinoi]
MMNSTSSLSGVVDETDAPPSSTALPPNTATASSSNNNNNSITTTSSSSKPSSSPKAKKWSQAPTPPRWRFVNDAKSTTGYNSTAAGSYIPGLSAEELAAKYSAPNLNNGGGGTKEVVDVGKLGRRDYSGNGGGGLMMEVGRLDVEEESDMFEEIIVGKSRRFGRRLLDDDGAEVEEEDVKQQDKQQQVIEVAEMMSMMEEEEDVEAPVERQEEEEETIIMPIQQIDVVEAEDSVIEDATDDVVEENEETVKEETAPVQVEESSSLQPIVETPLSDEKQPSPPLRKRQCLLLLMLLMILAATIIGIVFGTSSGNSSSEVDSTTQFPTSRCSAKEKYVSIRHYAHKALLPTDDATTRRIEVTAAPSTTDSTWSLKDSCSGEVLLKCEPCLFSDEGDIAFEFIEKKKNRIGGPDPEGEDIRRLLLNGEYDSSGMCVPDDREYSFEVRKTDGTGEDRCCNFDVTTFFVTFDNVTVVDSAHTIIDSGSGVTSTLFSNEGVDPCPTTDSPSLSPISSSPSAGPPPEAQCIAAGEDMNLCLAIDMSGSLCNRGTGYECLGCVLEAFTASICNKDGVEISTCCGNFHNVKEFAKRLISVFETIPSEQSYSIVGFATNASFVSNLVPLSVDAFSSLDSLAYSGGRTNHAAAISSCQQSLSNANATERKNMIMLITDGNPTEPDQETTAINDAIAAAIQAKEAGSILIPVMLTTTSIDNNTTDYMTEISSEGLFFNTSLSTLDSVEESLLSKVLC